MRTVNVAVNKVTHNQGIYPRFEIDFDRIRLFAEQIECDVHFPPVKVVQHNGFYVLLDGCHRLEAYKQLEKPKIPVEVWKIDQRHWRLAAARFNNISSKPLSRQELQKTIQDAWGIDGIRDLDEIAHELNCSERYVRKILKPVRDAEKEKLKEQVVLLKEEGLSVRQIVKKTDKPHSTVHRIVTSKTNQKENIQEKVSQNGTVPKWDTPKSSENPQEDEKTLLESVVGYGYRHKPDKTTNNSSFLEEPRSILPELEKLDRKRAARPDISEPLLLSEKQALRAMELAGAEWNVEQIAKRIDNTEQFVRNVAAGVIALFQNQSSKHPLAGRSDEKIAENLGMEPSVVEFIDEIVTHLPGVIPERKNIWWWLRENFPKYRSGTVERGSLIDIVRHETIYWKAIANNILPSWEEEKEQMKPLEKLPQDIEERFLNYMDLIDELIDIANKGGFKAEKITQAVLQRCNMVVTIQNKLRRKLGQWNVSAEDNKNCECTG
ncbi:MAG: ParB N-terminal domain-containing protein [Thermodesulfobacteriota bacterium]|nr:ParB N-terminal domain-containing protein [Thermodesulfobacteriota bacterium]